ncbi:MAG: hypothetical protein HEP71_15705 [Roseivirga sp.]|nr:hypothetical protein [Roseivirga sp.]
MNEDVKDYIESMKQTLSFFIFSIVLFSSCRQTAQKAPPLIDGQCTEYERLNAKTISLAHGVKLHIYQDQHYVWLCYCYREGSFGILDMKLETSQLDGPLNLHVSAQLGEWPLNKPELQPENSTSEKWWNHNGWTANAVWLNGLNRTEENTSPNWRNPLAREIQLSKDRFGRGEWKVKMNIGSIMTAEGALEGIVFPEGDKPYLLQVN